VFPYIQAKDRSAHFVNEALESQCERDSQVIFLNIGNNWREKATNLHCGIVLVGSGRDEQGTVLGNREPGPAALRHVKQHFTQNSTGQSNSTDPLPKRAEAAALNA
jgi:hypothetical protein